MISLAIAGHIGDSYVVAAVGLGNLFYYIQFVAVVLGMNTALSTFVSQSFGQGDLHMCGVYLNRGRVVITLIMPLIFITFALAGPFFSLAN